MANASSDLNAMFKEVYGEVTNLIPSFSKIQKNSKFISSDKENGNSFVFPILTSLENSITFGAPDSGLFTLEPISGMNTKKVSVKGSSILLRGAIDNETLSRSSSDRKSFVKGTKLLVDSLMQSGASLIETLLLYGGTDIGEVDSTTNVSTTKTTLTLTPGSFAAGIFQGRKGANLEFYNLANDTKIASTDYVTIDSIDSANYKITVIGSTGTIAAIDTYVGTTNCKIWFKGSFGNSMYGLDRILTNTGSMFGVDASTEDLWRGNVFPVGGAISYAKVMEALSLAVDRGLMEEVDVYLPVKAWTKLLTDQGALRKYDSSYSPKEIKNGAEAITFYGPNGGAINIHCSPMVKQSEGFIVPSKKLKRPGSSDWSFDYSGNGTDYFFPIPDKNGQEIRLFCNQGLVLETPARAVKLTGITY